MKAMNVAAKAVLDSALRRMEYASGLLEESAVALGMTRLVGLAYAEVLLCRGELAAIKQLLEIEEVLGEADTERPAPTLSMVRR